MTTHIDPADTAPTEPRAAVAYWQHVADTAPTTAMRQHALACIAFWRTLCPPEPSQPPPMAD